MVTIRLLFSNDPTFRQEEPIYYNTFTCKSLFIFLRLTPVPDMRNDIICVSVVMLICVFYTKIGDYFILI